MTTSVFDYPAFVDREYYKTRYETTTVQPTFWLVGYKTSALSYCWVTAYDKCLADGGSWKEAMKIADETMKLLEKTFKEM